MRNQVFQHQQPPIYSKLKLIHTYGKDFGHFAHYKTESEGTGHFSNNKTGLKQQAGRHNARQQNRKKDTVTYSISYEDSYTNSRTTNEVTAASNICHPQARDIWVFAAAFLSHFQNEKNRPKKQHNTKHT
jgi:hypothetical protein